MTPVQRTILRLMRKHIADGAGVPTLTWVAEQLGRSKRVVHEHLAKMIDDGTIQATRPPGSPRRYVPSTGVCPTCGRPLNGN